MYAIWLVTISTMRYWQNIMSDTTGGSQQHQKHTHHAPGVQRGRKLNQIGFCSKGRVYRPDILRPVPMVCGPAAADQQASKSSTNSDGFAAHPS
jgi:hypothetical protein